ncbi:Ubiquinone/menaquinone biosynthesis C-methylase UbiE [Chitinophaga sp. CF118]|uniref:class I SAM-dependent methyltransferase n=1 Tax=Chitinophaga sp. CF118 TaxID=1884367 RepID=UPI0008E4C199|nr:class I SAM-dependent methyltransferase [Chitinophaga sp. CF118]SFD76471.1 Ubiquinone/menaquinone biosynthesis C-methylase UbiE [Chitinophaga sp. CF118]
MKNNYDKIARYYDLLSRTVFQRSLINAQTCLLPYIKENSVILIVGGGTGWILEEIAKIRPGGLQITYVEISEGMIKLSQKRDYKQNNVQFVHQSIETFTPTFSYDVILTPFLFDNFPAVKATVIFTKLHTTLKSGGNWLFVDFVYDPRHGKLWQKLLLKTMYTFFRVFSKIEASELNDMEGLFNRHQYLKIYEQFHYGRFIWSVAYRKEK